MGISAVIVAPIAESHTGVAHSKVQIIWRDVRAIVRFLLRPPDRRSQTNRIRGRLHLKSDVAMLYLVLFDSPVVEALTCHGFPDSHRFKQDANIPSVSQSYTKSGSKRAARELSRSANPVQATLQHVCIASPPSGQLGNVRAASIQRFDSSRSVNIA